MRTWSLPGSAETTTLSELRDQIIQIVKEKGLLRLPEPVQLASGDWSSDFVDAKAALGDGDDLLVGCNALLELANSLRIDFNAVGGLTLGADQFTHVVAVLAHCKWFVVRKAAKGRGTNKRIEGFDIGSGNRILLVDDVVTRGASIQDAYEVIRATGAEVAGAVTLVDRGEWGRKFFEEQSIPYGALVTYRDLAIEPVGGGLINA
jgi:orotate phosphoribosyltransferase